MGDKPRKMVDLSIDETSGVDHPAHLTEGWLVIKSATAADVDSLLDTLTAPTPQEDTLSDTQGTDERLNAALEELGKAADETAEGTEPTTEPDATPEVPAAAEGDEGVEKAAEPTDAESFLKSAPESVRKMITDLKAEKDAAAEALSKEREVRADSEAVEKARTDYSALSVDPEMLGPALRRLASIDPTLAKAVETALGSANVQMESVRVFEELGKSRSGTAGSAWEKIEAIAAASLAAGEAKTSASAITKAITDNPSLYEAYLNEKKGA